MVQAYFEKAQYKHGNKIKRISPPSTSPMQIEGVTVLEQEIEIRELMAIIVKRWRLVVLLLIVAVITSTVVSFFVLPPIYESSTTLLVGKPVEGVQIIYQDIQLNRQLVKTYEQIIKSSTVVNGLISDLHLDITTEQFLHKIEVRQVGNTEIIAISVQDPSPEHAAFLANGVARAFLRHVAVLMNTDNVSIIDPAQVASSPIRPRKLLIIAVVAALSLIVGVFLAFFLEYLDNSIKSSGDVEKFLDMPVLGAIPVYIRG